MEMSSCLLPCPSKVWGDVSVLPVTSPGVLTLPLPLQFRAAATPDTSLEISKHPNMDVDTPQHVRNPPRRLLLLSKSYKPKAVTEPSLVHSAASAAAQMTTHVAPHHSPAGTWTEILPAALRGVVFVFIAPLRTRKHPGKINSSVFLPHAHWRRWDMILMWNTAVCLA